MHITNILLVNLFICPPAQCFHSMSICDSHSIKLPFSACSSNIILFLPIIHLKAGLLGHSLCMCISCLLFSHVEIITLILEFTLAKNSILIQTQQFIIYFSAYHYCLFVSCFLFRISFLFYRLHPLIILKNSIYGLKYICIQALLDCFFF